MTTATPAPAIILPLLKKTTVKRQSLAPVLPVAYLPLWPAWLRPITFESEMVDPQLYISSNAPFHLLPPIPSHRRYSYTFFFVFFVVSLTSFHAHVEARLQAN
ncbi:hypothetical protein BC828DRAFT_242829 [Blastocladiella britannica]|nr:hypothetical protein BC828DRAFT_242829 [Blastocladiella britannica]